MNTLVIVWRVTSHCNLDCRFCAYARSVERPRMAANPDQVMAFGALLQDYGRQYNRDVLVSWLGGEPLLWLPLNQLSSAFKHKYNVRASVATNGAALGTQLRELMDYDQITLSVDGLASFHDWVRNAPGLYHRLGADVARLAELKAGRGHGPLIRVNTIVMRDNIDQLESLCLELANWGVEELTFNALGGRDRPEFFPDHKLMPEHIDRLRRELPRLRRRMIERGLRICGSEAYVERLGSFVRGVPVPVAHCAPGQDFLFVDERGLVSPCSFTTTACSVPLASLHSPDDLRALPAQFSALRQQAAPPECLDCLSTEVFGKFSILSGDEHGSRRPTT